MLLQQKGLEFHGGEVCKTKIFKEMYEAWLKFPGGGHVGVP